MEEAITASHRQQYYHAKDTSPSSGSILLYAAIAVLLALVGLPWIVIGFAAQRLLARWLHWRVSLFLWMVLLFVGAFMLNTAYQHDLQPVMNREIVAYVSVVKHYQTDVLHWPLRSLWVATWPVWLRTWPGIGIAGFGAMLTAPPRTDMARTLRQREQQHQRRSQRLQRRATKQASLPARFPDEIDGMMMIGIPIHDDIEED